MSKPLSWKVMVNGKLIDSVTSMTEAYRIASQYSRSEVVPPLPKK